MKFLKEKLKRPNKRVNGHTHSLLQNILFRSYEGRQYSLARKVLFPSDYVMSLLVKDENTETSKKTYASISDKSDLDVIESTDIPTHKTSILMKPQKIQFSAEKDDCGIWYISGRNKQSKTETKRSDGTVFFRHGKAAVKNLVKSAI